jgi:hypothetical protein
MGDRRYMGSIAIEDLDGDGNPDLAATNSVSATVSVLLGNGAGSFGSKTDFATGNGAYFIAIEDLNSDGNPDLTVTNQDSATVSVLLGNGAGAFGARTDYATGTSPGSIAIEDLDGDGNPDLAVTNQSSYTVSVLLGNGAGAFGAKTDFATGNYPWSIAIDDLNGDGNPDLAVGVQEGESGAVSVLLNTVNLPVRMAPNSLTPIPAPTPTPTPVPTPTPAPTPTPTPAPTPTPTPTPLLSVIQSFEGMDSFNGVNVIGECCMYVAQVFTSEKTQLLGGISVNLSMLTTRPPMIEIWYTSGGRPAGLLETLSVPDGDLSLWDVLSLSNPIRMHDGTRFAIVVRFDGQVGTSVARWAGNMGNPYPAGNVYQSLYGAGDWREVNGLDLQFRAFSVE